MAKYDITLAALLFTACAAITGAAAKSSSANDQRIRLQCTAEGARDVSIDARYESRRGRAKFDASFEAAANAGFNAGQILAVAIGGVNVGGMTLSRDPFNGDIVGDLEFDTQRDENNPFPANFPAVGTGTSVTVGNLGCALN